MANREFLLKAHTQVGNKFNVKGWWCSEKLDGVRVLWDGGISRGLLKSQIPYANNKSKDDRFVTNPLSTGLWSSYGNPIYGPDWFLDRLPNGIPLDGELFAGRGCFQTTTSIVSKIVPTVDWDQITFNAFEMPCYPSLFMTGQIRNPHFEKMMDVAVCMAFVRSKIKNYVPKWRCFSEVYSDLWQLELNDSLRVVEQIAVHNQEDIEDFISKTLAQGGEGVMFRNPKSYWEPKRSQQLVKQKPFLDDEAIVVNYIWGRETDKGSKLLGMLGALLVDYKGKIFEIGTGFNDYERGMVRTGSEQSAHEPILFPGLRVGPDWESRLFPRGSTITFKYRELTDDGIPKESRFDRVRFGHA